MVAANISINAVDGSNPPNGTALPINVLVNLDNQNTGGELTYLWEFLDRPEGSAAALSNPAIQAPSFTPDVEGTYLLKLTVNRTLATEATDTVIVGISQLRTNERIPSAGETREESTTRGWAQATNRLLKLLDIVRGDGSMLIGTADGAMSRGHVLRVADVETIKAGLPGEEVVPLFSIALATSADDAADSLYLMEYISTGGTTAALGDLVRARSCGLHGPYPGAAASVGDPVYLGDTGVPALAAGTYSRRIGVVVALDGTDWYFHFDGAAGAGGVGAEPFVFATAPAGSYPSSIVLSALTAVLAMIQTVNATTLLLQRYSTAVGSIFEIDTELGDPLVYFDGLGDLYFADPDSSGVHIVQASGDLHVRCSGDLLLGSGSGSPVRFRVNNVPLWEVDSAGVLQAVGANRAISNVLDPVTAQDAATRNYVLDNSYTRVTFGSGKITAADTENYLDPGWATRAAPTVAGGLFPTNVATRSGVVRNLRVFCRTGPTGADVVIEIVVNGTPSGVKVTVVDGSTNASLSDTTHTAAITAGQTFYVRSKAGGVTLTDTEDITASFEIAAQ